jgi:putative ABC transport system ATP-binding protein
VVVDRVSRTFDGRIHALQDVSLHVRPGEVVLITGRSGSGKSTLLSLIGGLDKPDAGTVTVDGVSVADVEDVTRFRREVVGFVFQLHHLLPVLTAQGNVEVALLGAGVAQPERRERALALLGEVGLSERADHLPVKLSGGERQGVAIARALANRPRLLLADEPTGALDSASTRGVLDLLRGVRDRHGTTVIVVSHDPIVRELADRTLTMADGRLSEG